MPIPVMHLGVVLAFSVVIVDSVLGAISKGKEI